jgi:hypothetical protein
MRDLVVVVVVSPSEMRTANIAHKHTDREQRETSERIFDNN